MTAVLKLCGGCAKDIYPMEEQVNCDGKKYHKSCCKCHDCGCQLTVINYRKSSDYLDEHFLLCQRHYDDRFFLTRSKFKGKWTKSGDGSVHKIEHGKAKFDKFGKPTQSHSERQEVADKVFLVSTFNADTQQYEITIENTRDDPLTFAMDFSGSVNMQMVDGTPMDTFVSVNGQGTSDVIYLKKEDVETDHEMALDFFVHAKKDLSVSKWKDYNQMLKDGTYMVEESVEIADNIFLHSKFHAYQPTTFEFKIENRRDEVIVLDCTYSGSVNLRGEPARDTDDGTHVFDVGGGGAFSDLLTLGKVDKDAAHEIHMSFHLRDSSAPPPLPAVGSLSMDDSKTSTASPTTANKKMSEGIASRAGAFSRSNSNFAPTPEKWKESEADDCQVRYFGAQRLTMVSKLKK